MKKIIDTLTDQWLYDVEVLSQPWMYWCLLIPVIYYVIFMFIKWAVLTCPLWLPVVLMIQGSRSYRRVVFLYNQEEEENETQN